MRTTAALALGVFSLISAGTAFAARPGFGDTLTLGIGTLWSQSDATFAYTLDGLPETELDLSDLGMKDSDTVLWLGGKWQMTDRLHLGASYSSFEADGSNTAAFSGDFGDVTFITGADLTSHFESELYIVDLGWDFVKTEDAHLGLGVGVHVADLSFELGAVVDLPLGGTLDLGVDTAEVTAPLPNATLSGGMMIGEHLYLHGAAGYFSLNYKDYDGQLLSARAALEWRPFKRLGVGAGYQYVNLNLKVDDSNSDEEYDLDLYGPLVFLSVGF